MDTELDRLVDDKWGTEKDVPNDRDASNAKQGKTPAENLEKEEWMWGLDSGARRDTQVLKSNTQNLPHSFLYRM